MSEPRAALWPWLEKPLEAALAQLSSHAALLHGPEGVGQFEFALALARAWLCESQPAGQAYAPACGRCASCRLIDAGSHPDLMVILPEALQASLGWQAAGEETDSGSEKSGKTKKLSQEIKVDAIRAVVQFSQNTASRGRAKVVLVHPAERMNLISANTLLKTLEEPPGQVRFVLSGATLDELLPTVRSRCQAWRLPLPAPDVAASWLQTQIQGVSPEDARILLDAAGGQPLTARDRHQLGLDARYWPQIPKDLLNGAATALTQWPLTLVVETLQKVCHDLACVAAGASPRYFPTHSLPAVTDLHLLTTWGQELRKTARHAEHPWNQNLKVEALLLQARAVMRPRPVRARPTA
ncbi:MAG: DNA polymerase III subunit delta' [Aquabacterium sp.]|uniref:DNA polymerase III subunit delta' n=1 Tax=Aquabacterium sp. TaxID=1872578 RepID=UPI0025C6044C|nr:DNA polymerase III subunit delta' [Aquabacterium sp.]MBI5927285.1 DNA polymerase III subunit delta' [Aquabacterium sp.]